MFGYVGAVDFGNTNRGTIRIMRERDNKQLSVGKRYGSEKQVEKITGRSRKTIQKDRLFGRGFPYYRFSGQILYDLDEVEAIVREGRVEVTR